MKLRALRAILGALCLLATPVQGIAQPLDTGSPELVLAEVSINQGESSGQYLVARRGEAFFARPSDLDQWRINHAGAATETIDGEAFVALASLPDIVARFDETRQSLGLGVPAARFESSELAARPALISPTRGAFSAFVNYDLAVQVADGVAAGAFVEAGVSDDWGLVVNTAAVTHGEGATRATRLDSFYLRDNPASLTRLIVGDTVTDTPEWSRASRFGGVRLGTEFALQPNLITFPTPSFRGRTTLPSKVELLVDNAVRFQAEVDQGPFSIDQVPLVTGAGEVTLVVRDALGVERRETSSYYVSPRLLRRGLAAWSAEAGAERRGYGFRSFSYRNPFVAGTYRRGLTDTLTLETRAEISADVRMAGAGANMVWPGFGEFSLAGAVSQGKEGTGALIRASFARITPGWSLAVSYQRATRNFDQLGIDGDFDRVTDEFQASAGVSLGRWGSLGVGYTDLRYARGDRTRIASANYSVGVGSRGYLNAFALRSDITGFGSETTIGVGFTLAFGTRSSAYVQADSRSLRAEARRNAPDGGGFGYRAGASAGDGDRQQAELSYLGQAFEARAELARFDGQIGARAQFRGSLLWAGGRPYAARNIEGGMGLVNVPDQPNVRIYQDNRLIGHTDKKGRAVVPNLRPYQENRITLAPGDIPLDARMASDAVVVVPRHLGAALVSFDVASEHPATILLEQADGMPVVAGTTIRLGDGETAFAGYGGEVFVPDLVAGLALAFDTPLGACRIVLDETPDPGVLPRIGPLRCARSGASP